MNKLFLILLCLIGVNINAVSENIACISSPDKALNVNLYLEQGKPMYEVIYMNKTMIEKSPLGILTNEGDFSNQMTLLCKKDSFIEKNYIQEKIKKKNIHYYANTLLCTFENAQKKAISIRFYVSNNDIAFRYELPVWAERMACIVEKEMTGFKFPSHTTTFLSPMMGAMGGFARTSPSYESGYKADAPMGTKSKHGYVFPGLFKIGEEGWVLVSETGVRSQYCGSHLDEGTKDGLYTIAFPDMEQNNGFGSTTAAIGLPGTTPWRTITVSNTLKPIVETTIPFDVVDPLYEASTKYKYGRGTWSWILWQDNSINYNDQIKYIDLAAELNFEYILIDNWWLSRIGKEKIQELVKYARSKNVDVFLWYNSNGAFNDAPQDPRNKMNTSIARKKEMKWLKEIGVKGLKVDFFGGDKQETMRLYEDILSDANDYNLMIIFHGCTLPRGWERMYPNYVGSEAVVASEMLVFVEQVRKEEAFNATILPFTRNTVGCMEFGGTFLNKYLTKENKEKNKRLTTDAFQLATSVLFQNPIQMFALAPNNLTDAPDFELNFMKNVPTTWEETIFIDGYPGKFIVLARKSQNKWYVAGVSAEKEDMKLNLNLPMLKGKNVQLISDNKDSETFQKETKIKHSGKYTITMKPRGGFVMVESY